MNFEQTLNHYINRLDTSCKALSDASGLTPPVVNRYINGKRVPLDNSPQLNALINGLFKLSLEKPELNITMAELNKSFRMSIHIKNIEFDQFVQRLTLLLVKLDINMKHLANSINFDLSFLYRIRSGNTKPRNIETFASALSSYIAKNRANNKYLKIISAITGEKYLGSTSAIYNAIYSYLLILGVDNRNNNPNLMQTIDNIEVLNQFNTKDDFEQIPVRKNKLTLCKTFYDYDNIQRAELDFFMNTISGNNKSKDVYLFSDVNNQVLMSTPGYHQRWVYALTSLVKKGMRIHIIVNPNAPIKQRIQSIKTWLPLYITGNVQPYYINDYEASYFSHTLYLSDSCALLGEGILADDTQLRYTISNRKEEINFCRIKIENIWKNVTPLIRVFKKEDQEEYLQFLIDNATIDVSRHNILCSPPIYTLTNELANEILDNNDITGKEKEDIIEFIEKSREALDIILDTCSLWDEYPLIDDENQFDTAKPILSISELPISKPIYYTFEQYQKHIELSKEKADSSDKYTISYVQPFFSRIDIHIFKNKFAAFNNNTFPTSRFIISDNRIVECLDSLKF